MYMYMYNYTCMCLSTQNEEMSLSPFLPSDHSLPRLTHPGSRSRRISDLQDIPELDEDVSSSSNAADNGIPPPVNLELERQFVEEDMYRSALTCHCVYCTIRCLYRYMHTFN